MLLDDDDVLPSSTPLPATLMYVLLLPDHHAQATLSIPHFSIAATPAYSLTEPKTFHTYKCHSAP